MANGQFYLVFYFGGSARAYRLPNSGRIRIGRAIDNDVRLEHPSISRHHVRVHVSGELFVEDLGGVNGTQISPASGRSRREEDERTMRSGNFVDALPGAMAPVSVGDILTLGSVFAELTLAGLTANPSTGAGLMVAASGPSEAQTDQRAKLLEALAFCAGNQTRAAKLLGISRRTLINRLHQYQLPRPKK